jgi:hypothetical protein
VDLFLLDNVREPVLSTRRRTTPPAELNGPRANLRSAVVVALGTGMCFGEQLKMKRSRVDFLRNIVTARNTKNGRREIFL